MSRLVTTLSTINSCSRFKCPGTLNERDLSLWSTFHRYTVYLFTPVAMKLGKSWGHSLIDLPTYHNPHYIILIYTQITRMLQLQVLHKSATLIDISSSEKNLKNANALFQSISGYQVSSNIQRNPLNGMENIIMHIFNIILNVSSPFKNVYFPSYGTVILPTNFFNYFVRVLKHAS